MNPCRLSARHIPVRKCMCAQRGLCIDAPQVEAGQKAACKHYFACAPQPDRRPGQRSEIATTPQQRQSAHLWPSAVRTSVATCTSPLRHASSSRCASLFHDASVLQICIDEMSLVRSLCINLGVLRHA